MYYRFVFGSGPAVTLTETAQAGGSVILGFKIQCPAAPCASLDILWSVSGQAFVENTWPSPWTTEFNKSVYGSGSNGERGEGGFDGVYCVS